MSKTSPHITSIRNHLTQAMRLRKGAIGSVLIIGAFLALFGPRGGVSVMLQAMILGGGFVAFGLGWAGVSQALKGWSKQFDFDFEKKEVRQISVSLLGRARPYIVPFIRIEGFEVRPGNVAGEGGSEDEAILELLALDGRPFVRAGLFESHEAAEKMSKRLADAVKSAKLEVGIVD